MRQLTAESADHMSSRLIHKERNPHFLGLLCRSITLLIMATAQPDLLIIKQKQALQECQQNAAHLRNVIKELQTLKDRLETLPHELKRDIMVPFGHFDSNSPPLMMMPGFVKHTNEILVLLGDNWFIERSAKQSQDIIQRRMNKIRTMLQKYEAEGEQINKFIELFQKMGLENQGLVEITEEYDEEEEEKWRERHKQKVKEFKQREARERQQAMNNQASGSNPVLNPSISVPQVTECAENNQILIGRSNHGEDDDVKPKIKSVSKFKASRMNK